MRTKTYPYRPDPECKFIAFRKKLQGVYHFPHPDCRQKIKTLKILNLNQLSELVFYEKIMFSSQNASQLQAAGPARSKTGGRYAV